MASRGRRPVRPILGIAFARAALLAGCSDASGDGASGSTTEISSAGTVASFDPSSTTSTATTSTGPSSADSSGSAATTDDGGSTTAEPIDDVALFVSSDTTMFRFAIDLDTGTPTQVETIDVPSNIGPMVHDGSQLWVANQGDSTVLAYAIAHDGTPSVVAETPIGLSAVYVSRSEAGPHLLAADFNAGRIASFGVGADGAVLPGAISSLTVGMQPHAIVLAPDRRFAFVPHLGGDQIRQFTFDATTGVLAPNNPDRVDVPGGTGPRHMIFSADAPVAWVSNENGDSVTTWAYDPASGQLGMPQTISTLPDGTDGSDNFVADLHATPDGRFLYVSNRGADTIAIFAVQGDGTLIAMGHAETEATVRSFAIEPGGRFLYAAGQDSAQMIGYRIGADGQLEPIGTVPVPPEPVWVEAIAIPG